MKKNNRKEYRLRNIDKERERSRDWKNRNKEKCREYNRIWKKNHTKVDYKTKYKEYKENARVRKIVFRLSVKYFKENFNKYCSYCGDKIKTIGIDRVDNSKGYIKDNCVLCCKICNRMKLNYSLEDFIKQCEKIYLFNK